MIGLREKARPQQLTLTSPLLSLHLLQNNTTCLSLSLTVSASLLHRLSLTCLCLSIRYIASPLRLLPSLNFLSRLHTLHPIFLFLFFTIVSGPSISNIFLKSFSNNSKFVFLSSARSYCLLFPLHCPFLPSLHLFSFTLSPLHTV